MAMLVYRSVAPKNSLVSKFGISWLPKSDVWSMFCFVFLITLPETDELPLKNDSWKTTFLWVSAYFAGENC